MAAVEEPDDHGGRGYGSTPAKNEVKESDLSVQLSVCV